MPDAWTTRGEPGMRDRRICPLCDWYLDTGDPDMTLPADVAVGVKTISEATYLVMLQHVTAVEGVLRAHLETHPLEEWLRATADLAYLRGAVALGGLAECEPPDDERLFAAMNTGVLSMNDVRWIQFASHAIRTLTAAMKVVDHA